MSFKNLEDVQHKVPPPSARSIADARSAVRLMTTPGNCGIQSFVVGIAEADLLAAHDTLNEAMADAVDCEAGF